MKKILKNILLIFAGFLMIGGIIYYFQIYQLFFKKNEINKSSFFLPKKEAEKERKEKTKPEQEKCQNIPELPDNSIKLVQKIIDGDTLVIENGNIVRILGIDAEERNHPCYQAAKNKLEELILNKNIRLEKGTEDKDQWCRYLRYIFLDNQNIGLELTKQGLTIAYFFPDNLKYREEIINAEKTARQNKIGCKWKK